MIYSLIISVYSFCQDGFKVMKATFTDLAAKITSLLANQESESARLDTVATDLTLAFSSISKLDADLKTAQATISDAQLQITASKADIVTIKKSIADLTALVGTVTSLKKISKLLVTNSLPLTAQITEVDFIASLIKDSLIDTLITADQFVENDSTKTYQIVETKTFADGSQLTRILTYTPADVLTILFNADTKTYQISSNQTVNTVAEEVAQDLGLPSPVTTIPSFTDFYSVI